MLTHQKTVFYDHLRQADCHVVNWHKLLGPRYKLLFINTKIARCTFPWTQVVQVDDLDVEAGHPVPTLQPVQLLKIFLQGLWQSAHIKPPRKHHLKSLN